LSRFDQNESPSRNLGVRPGLVEFLLRTLH